MLLAADVGLWSGRPGDARRALDELDATGATGAGPRAEVLYRRAQLAAAAHDTRAAYELASAALALEPGLHAARALRAGIARLSVETATEVERFPSDYPQRFAAAETVTATVFPGARWSVAGAIEYRRRFATDNTRFALRLDARPTSHLTWIAFVRAGNTAVVPQVTAFVETSWHTRRWTVGARATYDRLPWPGDIYRGRLSGALALPRSIGLEVSGEAGALASCGDRSGVWAARGRLGWAPDPWDLGLAYGHGLDVDRAPTIFGDPCVVGGPPLDVRTDTITGSATRALGRRLRISVSLGAERLGRAGWVDQGALALRAWW